MHPRTAVVVLGLRSVGTNEELVMRIPLRSLAILLGCVLLADAPVLALPASADGGQAVEQHRLASLPRVGLWCRVQRVTADRTGQRWWTASRETTRPTWIVQPRWPQLFPDGRQSPLSLDPILRRHWWD